MSKIMGRRTGVGVSAVAALTFSALCAGRLAAQPLSDRIKSEVGTASWYGKREAGHKTASGAIFNPARLTAAHRTLPFGTCVRITRMTSGRAVMISINDRGPYRRGRIIDLSEAAASLLGMKEAGLARVRLEVLPICPAESLATSANQAMLEEASAQVDSSERSAP